MMCGIASEPASKFLPRLPSKVVCQRAVSSNKPLLPKVDVGQSILSQQQNGNQSSNCLTLDKLFGIFDGSFTWLWKGIKYTFFIVVQWTL